MASPYRRANPGVAERDPQFFKYNLTRPTRPVFVAEAGSNHCGDFSLACQLVDAAADAGAQGIKFQLFRRHDIAKNPEALPPETELPPDWLPDLSRRAHERDMGFMVSVFAPWAIPAAAEWVDGWKIGSFEALYTDLVFGLPRDRKPLFLSLGMTWDRNITKIVPFILSPGLVLMHCVSLYPTPFKQAGLGRITKLRNRHLRTGYSSHTAGWADVVVAGTMGICCVEKHLRLDDQPPSPDDGPWALRPDEFKTMIQETYDAIDSRRSNYARPPIPPGRKLFGA